MKKIIIGMSALTLITSTIVFAKNSNEPKKNTVTCSQVCSKAANCTAGSTCAVMPFCVCK